ncbi:hypothetical protein DPMN_162456 [Dreissena polymorpha]|uniref:Uncharacterized protein n=1 Tax=Dreissena polymorpha TaxID=45954 RepID=A0A9D4EUW9_DREPO|nr:hypothetical protein DPMN_162456 [Dreissena polymorpha]
MWTTDGRKTDKDRGFSQFAHLRGFHDDWAKNVISRKTATPRSHAIQLTGTIFKLNSHIKLTNVLTKFHENWAKNMNSNINKTNVLTNFHDDLAKIVTSREKTAPPPSRSHETNVLTKFHANWAKNVTSRVFTCFHYIHIENNALPTGGHVFSPIWTIFKLVRDMNKTNVLTNFHDDWAKIVTSRPCYSTETNVLTKFHENWAKNVTSRVFTCFHYIHLEKNAPPTGDHVFSPIWTIFKVMCDINKTNVLTNCHDDWAKILTSRVFTRKTAPPTGGHANIFTDFELDRDIIGTNLLTKFHEDPT